MSIKVSFLHFIANILTYILLKKVIKSDFIIHYSIMFVVQHTVSSYQFFHCNKKIITRQNYKKNAILASYQYE